MKKLKVLFTARFFLIYLYAVFFLNILSIFHIEKAGSTLNNQTEFFATLIMPLFLTFFFSPDAESLSNKQKSWAIAGLVVACPLIFALHLVFSL